MLSASQPVSDAAAATLARWLAACRERPGDLPPGCEVVHRRLVRIVGRGELPDVGPAYLKVMPFPRPKDRLRYAFRPLPARHEERMLRYLHDTVPGLPCPEPLAVIADRRVGLPWLSVLVTRALPVADGVPVTFAAMARAAARLANAGVEHPDLHAGNFLALVDGRVAVLDLQSARRRSGSLPLAMRRATAAKLLQDAQDQEAPALVDSGLVPADALAGVLAAARRLRHEATVRRIERCWRESTQFAVTHHWNGTRARRRTAGPDLEGVPDPEAARLWVGDRALEILDGAAPVLAGVFRKMPWLPGQSWVYIDPRVSRETVSSQREKLLAGHRRFLTLLEAKRNESEGA